MPERSLARPRMESTSTTAPTNAEQQVPLSISLEEARQVIWPFNRLFRPIGELLDSGILTMRDMAWAACIAPRINTRVREAARTILADKLALPKSSNNTLGAGPRVISGSTYLQRMEWWSVAEVGFLVGLASGFGLMLAYQFVQEWSRGTLTIPVLLVAAVLMVLAVRSLRKEIRRAYREFESYRRGRAGEDAVAERALANLDGNWTIFRNWVWPDRKDDVDLILVGPGGVWAVEVKTYSEGTRIRTSARKRWWRRQNADQELHPDVQASRNAARLKELLGQKGLTVGWVEAVLAFAEFQPSDFAATQDKLHVWTASDLDNRLAQLRSYSKLSREESGRIVTVLSEAGFKRK